MRKVTVALTGGLASVVMMLALHSRASADLFWPRCRAAIRRRGKARFQPACCRPVITRYPVVRVGRCLFRLLMPGPGRLPQVHRVLRAQPALWSPLIFLLVLPRLLFPQCTKSLR